MSHLVLELRAGETMVVNGATIRFRNKCRLELISQARFLFGKQLMDESEAISPLERLYYRLQTVYVGGAPAPAGAGPDIPSGLDEIRRDLPAEDAAQLVAIGRCFAAGEHYRALKQLRSLIERARTPRPALA